jgi:hypothetical protein
MRYQCGVKLEDRGVELLPPFPGMIPFQVNLSRKSVYSTSTIPGAISHYQSDLKEEIASQISLEQSHDDTKAEKQFVWYLSVVPLTPSSPMWPLF